MGKNKGKSRSKLAREQYEKRQNQEEKKGNDQSFEDVSFLNSPITCIVTLIKILLDLVVATPKFILKHFVLFTVVPAIVAGFFFIDGPHAEYRQIVKEVSIFVGWWVGLGIASSIGLGTGLHTFVLYLGPYMAKVTMVANECNQLPTHIPNRWSYSSFEKCERYSGEPTIGMHDIYYAVIIEAFLWGIGTAIGELPPYFVARAASMAGGTHEELENQEGLFKTVKDIIEKALKNHAFIVVILCASIPNPFFDLAGLTCGHFQIPFWTFFGATVIGKAFIKVSIQSFFVILMFSAHSMEKVINLIGSFVPQAEEFMRSELIKQKEKLYNAESTEDNPSLVGQLWGWVVTLMITYFVYAFLNAIVQNKLQNDAKKNK